MRIGVFYDGNYFLHVSNYYNYQHPRRTRISIGGLHDFIRHRVAHEASTDVRYCHVVSAHYFRGRLSASDAQQQNKLYYDRVFDDILASEGVVTHYLPLKYRNGRKEEKGIDVWLALEAYEFTIAKRFDVVVLITSDGDYLPLIRKLNTLGTRVMVLSWDFEYTDDFGNHKVTRTSQDLLEEVTYPVAMHELIDNRVKRNDPVINNLFVGGGNSGSDSDYTPKPQVSQGETVNSTVLSLFDGYGFIQYPPNNVFFHHSDIEVGDFNDLEVGDEVEFVLAKSPKGQDVAKQVRIPGVEIDEPGEDYFPEDEESSDEVDGDYHEEEDAGHDRD